MNKNEIERNTVHIRLNEYEERNQNYTESPTMVYAEMHSKA